MDADNIVEPALNRWHIKSCFVGAIFLPILIPVSAVLWLYIGLKRGIVSMYR